ncbi:MAG TPA: DeoR/GlpR family DNA-binding transcription regulator [Segeticoccus sp.]|nr:DeoR/GlpR family DNA-binding transcription regulator [Segeticoccus sp.]
MTAPSDAENRSSRKRARQQAITEAVVIEGTVRIEQLVERFDTSLMTVHRDLDELEKRGLLRKSRGVATATATSLMESSELYRSSRQAEEKEALAQRALEFVEPGQAIFLDDSTTVLPMAALLGTKAPLTVITNSLTLINELTDVRGLTLLTLGGEYYNWCNAFMGAVTTESIGHLRADVAIMSTAAVTDDVAFHQASVTAETKRAMFSAAEQRILLVDHTKFQRRALHAIVPLADFDVVVVDARTPKALVTRLRGEGINVDVAQSGSRSKRDGSARQRRR